MKRFFTVLSLFLVLSLLLFGCGDSTTVQTFQDGTYYAEYENFDSYGYKDYIEVVVQDGVVTTIVFNGINAEGNLKTEDLTYENDMQVLHETYPRKYTQDLVNQYLAVQNISDVDTVAGATYSSNSFTALFTALQPYMVTGNTEPIIIENIPVM